MARALSLSFAFSLLACAGAAAAQPAGRAPAPARSTAVVKALGDCRREAADAARLACYDAAAARLLAAEQAGEVVVVDRTQARAARRQAFGFNLPSLDFLGRGEREPRLDRVELVLARASLGPEGKLVLRTNDGQVWRQTDNVSLGSPPRAGSRAVVSSAALGSYFMKIDGQTAIRVRREQ